MQRVNLNNHIDNAIRKVTSNQLTPGIHSSNFSNVSFTFMSSIKPTGKSFCLMFCLWSNS